MTSQINLYTLNLDYLLVSSRRNPKDIGISSFRSYQPRSLRFSNEEIKTLNNLNDEPNIVIIIKPDKGNGLVILEKSTYNEKMEEIIEDETKFIKLNSERALPFKRKVNFRRFYLIFTTETLLTVNFIVSLDQ